MICAAAQHLRDGRIRGETECGAKTQSAEYAGKTEGIKVISGEKEQAD
jgi:hypothetical protein